MHLGGPTQCQPLATQRPTFLCVFLSLSEGNHIYAYNAKTKIQTLTGLFKGDKCRAWLENPRYLSFNHAGETSLVCQSLLEMSWTIRHTSQRTQLRWMLSPGADFLRCCPVTEGYYFHQETEWLIVFKICVRCWENMAPPQSSQVNRKVSQHQVDPYKHQVHLVRSGFASMLTKRLHFSPKSSKQGPFCLIICIPYIAPFT